MKEKLIQFMQGRYGIDTLNNHALFFVITLFILNIFFNNRIIMLLGYLIWLLVIYRMFSRQTYKRYQENEKQTGGRTFCYPIRERVRGRNVRKNQSAWNRTGWTWRNNHCSRSECEYLRDTYCRTSGGSQYLLSCEPACGEGSVRKNISLQM